MQDRFFHNLNVQNWRSKERLNVCIALKEAADGLHSDIDPMIEAMTKTQLMRKRKYERLLIAPHIERWLTNQLREQQERLQLSGAEQSFGTHDMVNGRGTSWADMLQMAGLAAVAASPVALMPAFISVATLTGTSFLVFTTSTVSVPILATLTVGAFAMSGTGAAQVAANKTRERYRKTVHAEIQRRVFGDGAKFPGLQGEILTQIDAVSQMMLKE